MLLLGRLNLPKRACLCQSVSLWYLTVSALQSTDCYMSPVLKSTEVSAICSVITLSVCNIAVILCPLPQAVHFTLNETRMQIIHRTASRTIYFTSIRMVLYYRPLIRSDEPVKSWKRRSAVSSTHASCTRQADVLGTCAACGAHMCIWNWPTDPNIQLIQ